MNITLVKQAIVTYVYDILHSKYPTYFKEYTFENDDGTEITYQNVYWSETMDQRPVDATECVLDIMKSESLVYGIDGKFYYNEDDEKYYIEEYEPKLLTINFLVTSMKNDDLSLTDLQAQNLVIEACSYIENRLKSGSALEYFQYENEIFTPIQVVTTLIDTTDILDVSFFEETQNRHTCQFRCKFAYAETGSREAKVATNAFTTLTDLTDDISVEFEIDE